MKVIYVRWILLLGLLLSSLTPTWAASGLAAPADVTVIAPDAGTTWYVDAPAVIHWKTNLNTAGSAVSFELWDPRGKLIDLGFDSNALGENNWPLQVLPVPDGAQYQIRVVSLWNANLWADSAPFAIRNLSKQQERWLLAGRLGAARKNFSATLLDTGKILLAGGFSGSGPAQIYLKNCELFDPRTNTTAPAAGLNVARAHHQAIKLADGRVLVAGGQGPTGVGDSYALDSCEIYNPLSDTWSTTASLGSASCDHRLARLADGTVLKIGGQNSAGLSSKLCEIFTPASGSWKTAASTAIGHQDPACVRLEDGRVLVAGDGSATNSVEIYDPNTLGWHSAGVMNPNVANPLAAQLNDRSVLIAGGIDQTTPTQLVYQKASYQVDLGESSNSTVYLVGGQRANAAYTSDVWFKTIDGPWQKTSSYPIQGSYFDPVVVNGFVYVAGGQIANNVYTTAVYYARINPDRSLQPWQATSSLPSIDTYNGLDALNGYLYTQFGTGAAYRAKINPDGSLGSWLYQSSAPNGIGGNMTSRIHHGYFYAFGGWISTSTFLNGVYYAKINADGTLGSWQATTSLPTARHHCSVHFYKDRVYVLGGISTSFAVLNTVLSAPIHADGTVGAWRQETSLPQTLWTQGSYMRGNSIYLLGGMAGYYLIGLNPNIYKVDINPADGTVSPWQQVDTMPGQYVVAPGCTYMPKESVTAGPDMPTARGAGRLVQMDSGNPLMIGGLTDGGYATANCDLYNALRDGWSPAPRLIVPRAHFEAVSTQGTIYVFGGSYDFNGGNATLDSIEMLSRSFLAADRHWGLYQ